jgi:hypothetical protein
MISEGEDETGKSNFISLLTNFKIEEILSPNLNTYYKGSLQIHQNVLDFMLIIPFSYPKKNSIVNIIEWRKKKEDDKKPAILDIPCKFQSNFDSKAIPERVLLM